MLRGEFVDMAELLCVDGKEEEANGRGEQSRAGNLVATTSYLQFTNPFADHLLHFRIPFHV